MLRVIMLAVIGVVASGDFASAQALRRAPVGRFINNFPVPAWMAWYGTRQQQAPIVIVPPTTGSQPGQPSGSSGSQGQPEKTVEIRCVLPVAGATISINNVDFGKTELFERKLNVPEAPDGTNHNYTVVAKWTANGKEVTQSRTVAISKNGKATANFFVEQGK